MGSTEYVSILLPCLNRHDVNRASAMLGGDREKVTIFGQSAGAQSVVAHLSSSASKGLFSSAISQSSLLGVSFVSRHTNSDFITPAVANATNCTSLDELEMVECLRQVPAQEFIGMSVAATLRQAGVPAFQKFEGLPAGLGTAETYLPITAASGGPPGIIDDQFQYLLGNDSIPNRVPFMVGTMRNEGGLFIPDSPGFERPVPPRESVYLQALESGAVVPNRTAQAIIDTGLVTLPIS